MIGENHFDEAKMPTYNNNIVNTVICNVLFVTEPGSGHLTKDTDCIASAD